MKKAMSVFLALGMTAALLAGCGSSNSAPAASGAQTPPTVPALSGTVSTNGSTSMIRRRWRVSSFLLSEIRTQ